MYFFMVFNFEFLVSQLLLEAMLSPCFGRLSSSSSAVLQVFIFFNFSQTFLLNIFHTYPKSCKSFMHTHLHEGYRTLCGEGVKQKWVFLEEDSSYITICKWFRPELKQHQCGM